MNKIRINIVAVMLAANCLIHAQTTDNGITEVYTANDIKSNGIISMNNIFELSDKWYESSINGYKVRAVGNLLSIFPRQNYHVLVNGRKMQLNFLDEQNLDLLPFTADQIDTIVFINSPTYYKGNFTESGLIDIKLKSSQSGFSIDAMQNVGNQVGDPGPYAYTGYRTPNVDKLGFNTGVNIKTSGNSWKLAVNLKYNENFVTDGAISQRIQRLTDRQKSNLLSAGSELNYNLLGGKHNVSFGFTQDDDFFFYPLYGNEIPSRRLFRHLAFSGEFPLSGKISLIYNVTKEVNELARLENSEDLDFNLAVNSTIIKLGSSYSTNTFNSYVGLNYEKHDANRTGLGNDEQINFNELIVNTSYNISYRTTLSGGIELLKNNNSVYPKYYLSTSMHINKNSYIVLSASYSESGLNEDLNYFTWMKSGVQLLTGTNSLDNFELTEETTKLFTADLSYSIKPFNNFNIVLNGLYRHFNNYYLENYIYNLTESGSRIQPELEIRTGEFIQVAGGSLNLRFGLFKRLSSRFTYVYQQPVKASENFDKEWDKFPMHVSTYRLDYSPAKTFNIWLKLNFTSETSWREFGYINAQSYGRYSNVLPGKLLLDASLQKSFWQGRLWLNLLFKNILNRKDVRNPIGINNGLRFYLIAQLQLESLFN